MKTAYLIYSFTGFVAWVILDNIGYQFKWIGLGFAIVMLLLGIFMKDKVTSNEAEVKAEEIINEVNNMAINKKVINDLNKIGGNKNDI